MTLSHCTLLKSTLLALLLVPALGCSNEQTQQPIKSPRSIGKLTAYTDEAYEGLTLLPVMGKGKTHLISMKGELLHTWDVDANRARLLPNGNLLVVHGSPWGRTKPQWRKLRNVVREYRWDGSVAWEYKGKETAHHDVHRLPNGNTIFLTRALVPEPLLQSLEHPLRRLGNTRTDAVVKVSTDGDLVWRWEAHEHVDLNYCGNRGCQYLEPAGNQVRELDDWTHVNALQALPENRWFDEGDERFKPGNILLMPRNWWTAVIVDRETGKIVWEYSGSYKGGLAGGHEPHMIQKGLPGEGNILIFDNGQRNSHHAGESYILEINPVTKEPVWVYDVGDAFFSNSRGSVQRLPNGNTLISEDNTGRVFEVTKEGRTVWEFRTYGGLCRASRYNFDFCAGCDRFRN